MVLGQRKLVLTTRSTQVVDAPFSAGDVTGRSKRSEIRRGQQRSHLFKLAVDGWQRFMQSVRNQSKTDFCAAIERINGSRSLVFVSPLGGLELALPVFSCHCLNV